MFYTSLPTQAQGAIGLHFKKPILEKFLKEWSDFKLTYEKKRNAVYYIEDEEQQKKELENPEKAYAEWKLRKMGTAIGSSYIVKKGSADDDGIRVKMPSFDITDLLD